ncbi:hypothetical protein [Nocardia sp. NPDC049149]|uniref:hypothetical protein n=1 Tax=Nocardia sp. NPDC049149 TaxID=3364315 RepID=UPI00371196C8
MTDSPEQRYRRAMFRQIVAVATLLVGCAFAAPTSASADATSSLTLSAINAGTSEQVILQFTGPLPTKTLNISDNNTVPVDIGADKPRPIGDSKHYIHLGCLQVCWSGRITNNVPFKQLPLVRGAFDQVYEGELALHIGLATPAAYTVSGQGTSHIVITVQH